MAKRSQKNAAAAPKRVGRKPSKEQAPLVLAEAVASQVQIQEIFAEDYAARRTPEGFGSGGGIQISMPTPEVEVGRVPEENEFNVQLKFSVQVRPIDADPDSPPGVEMHCRFVLIYRIGSFEGVTDEHLVAFGNTSGVFNAWPFWREFVASSCNRLAVPPLVIPTYLAASGE